MTKSARHRRFRQIRIGALLALLVVVLLFAYTDVRSRRQRNEWTDSLSVAVVLLEEAPIDPAAIEVFRARVGALEMQLQNEEARYRSAALAPVHFEVFGPARVSREPPAPEGTGPLDLVRYTWELRRYIHAVDSAMGIESGRFGSRVYTTIRPPIGEEPTHVEGRSELGGRIAQVRVELDTDMADLALVVVTHELLHTLGATDKYDTTGRTRFPEGLADPTRQPLLPQDRVEVMARNRPVGPGQEVVPTTLLELGVGPTTAREIGWLAP